MFLVLSCQANCATCEWLNQWQAISSFYEVIINNRGRLGFGVDYYQNVFIYMYLFKYIENSKDENASVSAGG